MPNTNKSKNSSHRLNMVACKVHSSSGRVLLSVPSLKVTAGSSLGIYGPSGAGKTTLLYSLAGLLNQVDGSILWGETDLLQLSNAQRSQFRADHIGMIFQDFQLFDELGALTNASISAMYAPRSERAELKQCAEGLLGHFGLNGANRSVVQLSGGERQRVAVARALTKTTGILLADEPTASLDREMADSLINYLMDNVRNTGKTLIAVSHDPKLLCRMDQTVELEGGLITGPMKTV